MSGGALEDVLWLGGSPCAGKSTVAERLAGEHGLRLYSCDAEHERHAAEARRRGLRTFVKLATLGFARIMGRPHEEMLRDALELCREEFPMILEDLAALPPGRPVLAEGTALLPELVAGAAGPDPRAVWLVPTEAAQRERYARRPWAAGLLRAAPDPDGAWDRWMRRDTATAEHVRQQAQARGLPVVVSDRIPPLEDTAAAVARHLRL